MLGKRLSIISMGTRDIDAQLKFYESLGWTAAFAIDGFALINLAGAPLALASLETVANDLGVDPAELEDGGKYGRYIPGVLVDTPDEVDAQHKIVQGTGARLLTAPATQPWGVRNFYFTDPEGNLWEVAHVPGLTFGAQDAAIWPLP